MDINNDNNELNHGHQNYNTSQILAFGGYVKTRESLFHRVIIWVSINMV